MVSVPPPFGVFDQSPAELSLAEVFELLSNKRRRGVIHYIKDCNSESVTVEELVEAVVEWESDGAISEVSESQRASVYSSLVQTHLPRLDEAAVIDYDDTSGTIKPTRRTREIELYLEYSPSRDIPWAEFYIGFTAVAAALIAVVWVEIPPFDTLSGLAVAGLIVVGLLLASLVHLYETRRSRVGSETFEEHIEND